jgi:hypothetical protein
VTLRTGSSRHKARFAPLATAMAIALAACSRDEGPEAAQAGAECGRDCLIGLLDRYLVAVVSHDPAAAPLTEDFRGTQNAAETPPGEGVWASVTGLGALQRRYADPETGQAVYLGLIGEGDTTAIASLRIRAEGRRISEAEWIIARDDQPFYNVPAFTANPPPNPEGLSAGGARDAAIAAAQSYFDGIEASDASGVIAYEDCFRVENGTWMVGRIPERAPVDPTRAQPGLDAAFRPDPRASCIGGFQALEIPAVSDRHYVFDADAGMLWAAAVFEREAGAVDGFGRALPRLYLSNLFRVEDGRIRGIYSVTTRLPEEISDSGWARE